MQPTGQAPERPLVLLAESQAILALDIAAELDAAGFAVAGPFATCADLRGWAGSATPDAAILDLDLRDGSCLAEAMDLARRGVPVAILAPADATDDGRALTWFAGPVEPRLLVRFLRARTARPETP